ncbi:hypothetical protein EB235_19825 [Mesorhizobium loti R88b]|uniref:Uncharacterized protein n=2 Tax=Rhizobium loti TaxID=381 RepID=A0A6M7WTW4_RHILI|nr:hypothetical protein EB235_19825 [Mesorhizobium loti R88b]
MEQDISLFILAAAKFEFFLVNRDIRFAHVTNVRGIRAVTGVNWSVIAVDVENRFPFASFDFAGRGILIFKETVPQYLTVAWGGALKWDSDNVPIDSWDRLLARSYAQLRNNVAHGNKHQMPAPFTYQRTLEFLPAGHALMDFVATQVFDEADWNTPIFN